MPAIKPAITYPPFDGDGISITPHRPSLDQLGGNSKENEQPYPTSSAEPSADEWNRFAELIALFASCMPTMMMTVSFSGGAPQHAKFWAANSALTISDFTLTDNGDGDTTISWDAGLLPVSKVDPVASMNDHTNATTISAVFSEAGRWLRIRTTDESAGAGVDTRFTVIFR